MKKLIIASILVLIFSIFISGTNSEIEKEYLNEESIEVESWMTKSFNTTFYEEPLEIEDWMLKPFQLNKI